MDSQSARNVDPASDGVICESRKYTWTVLDFDRVRKSKVFIDKQKIEYDTGNKNGSKLKWKGKLEESDDLEGIPWIGIQFEMDAECENVNNLGMIDIQVKIRKDDDTYFFNKTAKAEVKESCKYKCGFTNVIRKDTKLEDLPLLKGNLVIDIEVQVELISSVSTPVVKSVCEVALIEDKYKIKFAEKMQWNMTKLFSALLEEGSGPSQRQVLEGSVKITSADDKEFVLDRELLSVRSPVFKAMLQENMSEDKTRVIKMDDISSNAVIVLLQYIKTGTLHDDWSKPDVVVELVKAAGRYQLGELLEFLDQLLGSVCSKENVRELLNLSKKLGLKKAEQMVFEFMKNVTGEEIVEFLTGAIAENN